MTGWAACEQRAMREAIGLAEQVVGLSSPNPPVGCVLLSPTGEVVGRGASGPVGGPHAEVAALAEAGDRAAGATAVVTLEPCRNYGRTPPCTDALITAGVARVVYAVEDPTQPGGGKELAEAGIDLDAFLFGEAVAHGPLRYWLMSVATGRPYITLKLAATLDGRVAATDGTSQWITGAEARQDMHRLYRRVADAIVVGSGTALADDPHLTVRDPGGGLATRQPLRVVLDRRHRLPDTARVRDTAADTLILDCPDLDHVMAALTAKGVLHAFVEGGPTLASQLLAEGLVDQLVILIAPTLLGAGRSVSFGGITHLSDALRMRFKEVARIGEDLMVRVEFPPPRLRHRPAHHHRQGGRP